MASLPESLTLLHVVAVGYYMLLDSPDPGTALLRSPRYQSLGCLTLSFYYTLHGVSNDTVLNVFATTPGKFGAVAWERGKAGRAKRGGATLPNLGDEFPFPSHIYRRQPGVPPPQPRWGARPQLESGSHQLHWDN